MISEVQALRIHGRLLTTGLPLRVSAETNFRSRLVLQQPAFPVALLAPLPRIKLKDAREGACLSATFQV
jgi:hypothetical protein